MFSEALVGEAEHKEGNGSRAACCETVGRNAADRMRILVLVGFSFLLFPFALLFPEPSYPVIIFGFLFRGEPVPMKKPVTRPDRCCRLDISRFFLE